jgi:hypothetical protein
VGHPGGGERFVLLIQGLDNGWANGGGNRTYSNRAPVFPDQAARKIEANARLTS